MGLSSENKKKEHEKVSPKSHCHFLQVFHACPEHNNFLYTGTDAKFFQNCTRLSSTPKSVVKMVESASKISPARSPDGGIQRNILNSLFPASINGCGLDISIGCFANT